MLAAATDESGDLVSAEEAVPIDNTKNLRVTVGESDGAEIPAPGETWDDVDASPPNSITNA